MTHRDAQGEPAIPADDPRRPNLLELRARQVLALSLECAGDTDALVVMWALALAELGEYATNELLGTALGLLSRHLPPAGRTELAGRVRAGIPPLLVKLKLEGEQPK